MSTANLFEYHDSLVAPNIDCRVDLGFQGKTYTLQVDVPRADLLGEVTPANLADACEQVLGFPVTYTGQGA